MIVKTRTSAETIKDSIVSRDDRYYLVPSTNPQNTYQVLWFRLTAVDSERELVGRATKERSCKVDILIPGTISIPWIPYDRIIRHDDRPSIPLTPIVTLIMLKLRGWADHKNDPRKDIREKLKRDEDDLEEMLTLAVNEWDIRSTEDWWPWWFVSEGDKRIADFVKEWPGSKAYWNELGFDLDV